MTRRVRCFHRVIPSYSRAYNGDPRVPFSLPLLRVSLSALRSLSSIQQPRHTGRPSRRRLVGFSQRTQGFAGIMRFTVILRASASKPHRCSWSAAVCFAVRTTGK